MKTWYDTHNIGEDCGEDMLQEQMSGLFKDQEHYCSKCDRHDTTNCNKCGEILF